MKSSRMHNKAHAILAYIFTSQFITYIVRHSKQLHLHHIESLLKIFFHMQVAATTRKIYMKLAWGRRTKSSDPTWMTGYDKCLCVIRTYVTKLQQQKTNSFFMMMIMWYCAQQAKHERLTNFPKKLAYQTTSTIIFLRTILCVIYHYQFGIRTKS